MRRDDDVVAGDGVCTACDRERIVDDVFGGRLLTHIGAVALNDAHKSGEIFSWMEKRLARKADAGASKVRHRRFEGRLESELAREVGDLLQLVGRGAFPFNRLV